jgi:hypothetical protein
MLVPVLYMAKTLYVRTFSESIHDKLNDISREKEVPVGSIIEEAVNEWIKHKEDAPRQHNLVLYSDEESLMYFLKKMEDLTKQDWNRIILGPESHQGKNFLKKKQWIDVTISPYAQGLKNAKKYSSLVFNKVNKEAKGRASMFMGFLTGDVAARYSLRKSIELEKIANDTIKSGIVFCPFNMKDLVGANMVELFDLINEHEKIFVLKKNEVFELNLNKTNYLKLLIY